MSQEYGLGGGGEALFAVVDDTSPSSPFEVVDLAPLSPNDEGEAEYIGG
jgi:hypothetical protein